jgi:hypothetical protein
MADTAAAAEADVPMEDAVGDKGDDAAEDAADEVRKRYSQIIFFGRLQKFLHSLTRICLFVICIVIFCCRIGTVSYRTDQGCCHGSIPKGGFRTTI